MKPTHSYIITAILLGSIVTFSGCTSTDLAVAQAHLNQSQEQQFRKAQTKTRAQGGALGALAGAAIGYAVGGGRGAAIGAAVGGAAGLAAGEHKARIQGQILVTERQLNGMIASTASANQRLRAQVSQMSAQRKAYQQKIAAAKSSGNSKALASIRQEIQSSMAKADASIASASKTAKYNSSVSGESAAKQSLLHNETSKLRSSVRELQSERSLMGSLYNSVKL